MGVAVIVGTAKGAAVLKSKDRKNWDMSFELRGWPVTVLSRGRVIVSDGKRSVEAGSGRFLARGGGEAAKPTGRLMPDMDPELNFGARLL